jgi:hypothetical protein
MHIAWPKNSPNILSVITGLDFVKANREKPIFAPIQPIADNGAIFPLVCRIDPLAPWGGSVLKPKQIE